MNLNITPKAFLALAVLFLGGVRLVYGGGATTVYGLYYTGVDDSYTLLSGGTDSHWSTSFARVGGSTYTGSSTYTGASYVVSSTYIDGGWVPNSSTSRWITAPGASTAGTGGTLNLGGDQLSGNGDQGTNSGFFVYKLAFTISGAGGNGSNVTNNVAISLTIAADDQYSVYVNPASAPTVDNAGVISTGGTAASGSRTSAWNNTNSLALQNFGSGPANNAKFQIGTNYLYIVVANTNSQTGTNGSTALNPSGLLVYQIGATATINGTPVPEVGTLLPVFAAIGAFGWRRFRRDSKSAA